MTFLVREFAIENSIKKKLKWKEVFVIPIYNEEDVVLDTINSILKKWYKSILVVNDGSKDRSRELLSSLWDSIILLNHVKNRWQWAALETGFEYVRRYWDVDFIVTFDWDWQHDIKDLQNFYEFADKNKNIDIFLGSRFLKKNNNVPFLRKILLKLWIFFTYMVSDIRLTDTHNWYRVIRRKILNKIKITQDGMSHASEIIDIVSREKIKFKEVPVNIQYTQYSLKKWQKSSNAINIAIKTIWNKFFR
jgi:glycosyltransferase involved in cell wall biosynthesis